MELELYTRLQLLVQMMLKWQKEATPEVQANVGFGRKRKSSYLVHLQGKFIQGLGTYYRRIC